MKTQIVFISLFIFQGCLWAQNAPCPEAIELIPQKNIDTFYVEIGVTGEICTNLDTLAYLNYWWKFTIPTSNNFELKGFPISRVPYLDFYLYEDGQMKGLTSWSKINFKGELDYFFLDHFPGETIYMTPSKSLRIGDEFGLSITSECPNFEIINYTIQQDETISMGHSIVSSDKIENNAIVTFSAGDSIILHSGFEIESGAELLAELGGCLED